MQTVYPLLGSVTAAPIAKADSCPTEGHLGPISSMSKVGRA